MEHRVLSLQRRPRPTLASRGFTLIELMVTLAVVAVLLTLAAPSFLSFQRNSQLTSAANSFVAALSAARAEAMKRQLNAFVRPASGDDWTQGWVVYVDGDWDNAPGGATDVQVLSQSAPGAPIVVSANVTTSDGLSHYVMFSGAGFMITVSNAVAPTQGLELYNGTDKRLIIASPAGRLRVCTPAPGTCDTSGAL